MKEASVLRIKRKIVGDRYKAAILLLDGYIDSNTAPQLKETLLSLGKEIHRFILDFSDVQYVSSAGWGIVLARIKEHREHGGDIVFVNMSKEISSVYELLELDKVIKHYPNAQEALNGFGEVT
jgi:anti-sigma B factor antagonist